MENTERDRVINSLASTLAATRSEIDGMRMVLQAALGAMSQQPPLVAAFKAQLALVREADAAISLASAMPDSMLQAREDWVQRLTPANMK